MASEPASGAAAAAVARLGEMSVDLRGCAILDARGSVLAATGDPAAWAEGARELWAAADSAGDADAGHVHVATEGGEVFAVRQGSLSAIAVTERFTLASLMLFDMRSVLRDLAGATG
jgi:hypothetical protein